MILTATEPGKAIWYNANVTISKVENGQEILVGQSGNELPWDSGIPASNEYATATVTVFLRQDMCGEIDEYVPGEYRLLYMPPESSKGINIDFELVASEKE